MVRLVEHLHVFFIHFRREWADHRNALETISSQHIAGLQGELLGFSVKAGGKISLIGSQSAGESSLQPLSRLPLDALQRGLCVGDDLAGKERHIAIQFSLVKKDSRRTIAAGRIEESRSQPS